MASIVSIDQNIDQVQPYVGQAGWATLTTANTAKDGTGTTSTVFTSAANGSGIAFLRCKPLGTNIQSLLRIFINNGLTSATAANNSFFDDATLPATTNSETDANQTVNVPINISLLPIGYKINVCIATTVASGWQVTAVGGDN